MHKLVSLVFKIILGSMLFLFILDTSLVLFEVFNIHSRVTSMAGIMQSEISRNNCLPSASENLFINYFEELESNSRVLGSQGIVVNWSEINDSTYLNVKDYGDHTTLTIMVYMQPQMVYFNMGGSRTEQSEGWLYTRDYSYILKYEYTIPCLRYLK